MGVDWSQKKLLIVTYMSTMNLQQKNYKCSEDTITFTTFYKLDILTSAIDTKMQHLL